MRALLDTHTFLWWNLDDTNLSERARTIIADSRNDIFFSAASAWEIAIKYAKGRLELPETPEHYVTSRLRHHHFTPLPVQLSHALHVYALPAIRQDPFDRLLVAQCHLEGIPLLTSDQEITLYDIEIIW